MMQNSRDIPPGWATLARKAAIADELLEVLELILIGVGEERPWYTRARAAVAKAKAGAS